MSQIHEFLIAFLIKDIGLNLMVECSLYNYAGDNIDWYSAHVCLMCNRVIEWFTNNGMRANPDKFQFSISSFLSVALVELFLDNSTCQTSQDCVKVLGIAIYKQLMNTLACVAQRLPGG